MSLFKSFCKQNRLVSPERDIFPHWIRYHLDSEPNRMAAPELEAALKQYRQWLREADRDNAQSQSTPQDLGPTPAVSGVWSDQ